jgi:hypothetical protein
VFALPLAGGALDVDAEVTASTSPDGNDRSVHTEFGGWGFGVKEKIDGTNTGTQATMEPDGFRAYSDSDPTKSTHLSSTALTLDNGAKLRKGTTDAGNGGYKGIALECSAQYELKWEAGRLYAMEQDGFTIRRVEHCGTSVPQTADDVTKGFIVGSRWVLNDGTLYRCENSTEGAAVWSVVFTPTSLVYTSMLPDVQTHGGSGSVMAGHPTKYGGSRGSIRLNGGNSGAADEDEGNGGDSGSINLSGEVGQLVAPFNASGSRSGGSGGSLLMNASGTLSGGSINTSAGGGSIDTRAKGSIQLGTDGQRTTLTGTATANRSIALPDASGTLAVMPETRMVYWVGDGSTDVVNATTGYLKTSRGLQPPMPIAASRDLYLTVRNVTGQNRAIILPRQQTQIDGNGDTRDILNLGPPPSAHTDKAKNGDRLILDYRASTNSTLTVKAYPFQLVTLANVGGVFIPYVGYYTNLWGGTPLGIENYSQCDLLTITAEGLYAFELVDGAWAYRGLVSGIHTHGSLTSDGKLGTAANCYVTTTTGGAIIAGGSFYNKYTQTVTASGANSTNPLSYGKRSEQIFIFDANSARQFTLSAGVLGDVIAVTAQAGASALGSVEVSSITVSSPIATLQVGHSREFIYNGTAWELVPLRSSGGVTQIVAGSNVSISPTSGTGAVTINTTNSPFVISAASASGLAGTTGQTVGPFISYFNGTGGAGYSSGVAKRQRTLHQACVIKKACITLSSGNATTVSDGVVSFYNNTTSTDYVLYSGLVADTTQAFVTHDATNLNIPVSAGDKFSFKISWPTTNPADVKVMVDLYCYPV